MSQEAAAPVRVMPVAQEAEEAVLGQMISSPHALEAGLELLQPEHFWYPSNGLIFAAMRDMHAAGTPVDVLTLTRELESRHSTPARRAFRQSWQPPAEPEALSDLESVGGRVRIVELVSLTTATANIRHHCQLILDAWGKRECIRSFTEPMRGAWNGASAEEVLGGVERALLDLRARVTDKGDSRIISAQKMAETLEERMRNPIVGRPPGTVASPFRGLRELWPGRTYFLGGYPADGKTAASVQFIKSAVMDGKRVGLFSVEMSWDDVMTRIVQGYGVPEAQIRSGQVSERYRESMVSAIGDLARANFDVIDDSSIKAHEMARTQRVGRYDFLVIDHLHRIDTVDRKDLERQIKTIVTLSRTAGIPILVLAQFHRPFNTDRFPEPTMTSWRETGVVEQEAAACWAIYRERDEDNKRTDDTKFIVMKNRFGPEGDFPLRFVPEQVKFTEIDYRRQ